MMKNFDLSYLQREEINYIIDNNLYKELFSSKKIYFFHIVTLRGRSKNLYLKLKKYEWIIDKFDSKVNL